MENSNFSRNRQIEHLGVNKMGKNIKKSPLHQPNFSNQRPPPQPQVYNISKNEFRNIVQKLTGSPSPEPPQMGSSLPPNHHPSKPPNSRLQRIRPPPLSPVARPPLPISGPSPFNDTNHIGNPNPNSSSFFNRPPPPSFPQSSPGNSMWASTAESPISAYMRYLQNSILDSGLKQNPPTPLAQHTSSSVILPSPPVPALPSPTGNGPAPLPSPTSQFVLPSPTSFLNLLSPPSHYPLLSPGFQFPPPLSPNFSFSPFSQSPGILGSGPLPPASPGLIFPSSPSGLLPILSPRWSN